MSDRKELSPGQIQLNQTYPFVLLADHKCSKRKEFMGRKSLPASITLGDVSPAAAVVAAAATVAPEAVAVAGAAAPVAPEAAAVAGAVVAAAVAPDAARETSAVDLLACLAFLDSPFTGMLKTNELHKRRRSLIEVRMGAVESGIERDFTRVMLPEFESPLVVNHFIYR